MLFFSNNNHPSSFRKMHCVPCCVPTRPLSFRRACLAGGRVRRAGARTGELAWAAGGSQTSPGLVSSPPLSPTLRFPVTPRAEGLPFFLYFGSIVRRFLCDVVDLCSTHDLEEPRSIGAFFLCLVASEYLGSTQSSVSW